MFRQSEYCQKYILGNRNTYMIIFCFLIILALYNVKDTHKELTNNDHFKPSFMSVGPTDP